MIPLKDLIRLVSIFYEIFTRAKRKPAPKPALQKKPAIIPSPARPLQAASTSKCCQTCGSQKPGLVRRFFSTVFTILQIFVVYQLLLRLLRRYLKFPAPAFIGRFLDSDVRRRMQPPSLLIERSGVQKGMKILEIGCGSGAYTPFFARSAGEDGQVYALDIQPAMLRQIQNKLLRPENQDIANLQVVEGSAYELPFEDETLDMVYMVTVFQEIPDKMRTLKEVRRVLKRRGILAVTELLPDPDYPWLTTTVRMVKAGGFRVDDVGGDLWNYTVRFRKP
jgi:SAM-dependent methyltransferase